MSRSTIQIGNTKINPTYNRVGEKLHPAVESLYCAAILSVY